MVSELIKKLLEAGVHFGHQTKRWNPKMKPFIFGARSGVYIIDLEKTAKAIEDARGFLTETAKKGGYVLFVGTKNRPRMLYRMRPNAAACFMSITDGLGARLPILPLSAKGSNGSKSF